MNNSVYLIDRVSAIQNALEPVGWWAIGGGFGLNVYQRKKPRWITRILCKHLLEWDWIDAPKNV
jgi:hypothetical protein